MREVYPECFIIGDNSVQFNEICKSLRFSTHCDYKILSQSLPFDLSNCHHMEWQSLADFEIESLVLKKESLVVSCYKGQIHFGSLWNTIQLKSLIENHRSAANIKMDSLVLTDESTTELKKKIDIAGLLNVLEEGSGVGEYLEKEGSWLSIDFLQDFEGKTNFIGGIAGDVVSGNKNFKLIDLPFHQNIQANFIGKSDLSLGSNMVFALKITRISNNSSLVSHLEVNKMRPHWDHYRAAGINIPLVLIQNLLNRKIKTFYFVAPEHITFSTSDQYPKYNFKFDTVYFDLDDTLIWKGKPISEAIEWLNKFQGNNISLILITRHKRCVKTALAKIGLSEEVFEKVIRVYPEQKKSSFISGKSIFIDNEFPQRLDVHLKCKIPVLDVDQIDFLS